MKSILVVEDETDIRELLVMQLERAQFQVSSVCDGESAVEAFRSKKFDLLVLDWMLPRLSGLEVLREIRRSPIQYVGPVLMLTARVENKDIVEGLETGADDFLTKPYHSNVLIARIRALLRRTERLREANSVKTSFSGDLQIDWARAEVKIQNSVLELTPNEFKLLRALFQNSDRVLTRDQLIQLVQGEGISVIDRAIDTHIHALRKKLGAHGSLIETVRGVGYRVSLASESEVGVKGGENAEAVEK